MGGVGNLEGGCPDEIQLPLNVAVGRLFFIGQSVPVVNS